MKIESTLSPGAHRGAAFLILVVLVLLVVVAATRTLVTGEISLRRAEVSRSRAKSMNAAINATLDSNLPIGDPIRFPIESSLNQWIEVSINQDVVTARWIADDRVLDEVTRGFKSTGSNADPEP